MNFKKYFKPTIIFLLIILITFRSSYVFDGVKSGLKICFSSVIPALFPFMVLSGLFIGSMKFSNNSFVTKFSKKLFGISAYGSCAFLCGMLCGFPIGAKCAVQLYEEGKISHSEAETLIACANNSGPLFVVGALGMGILKSYKAGLLLYAVQICCAVLTAIMMKSVTYTKHIPVNNSFKKTSLTTSICDSVSNTLNVCGFIVFFAAIIKLAEPAMYFMPGSIKSICMGILELTNGIYYVNYNFNDIWNKVIVSACLLSWSGISVHMQVKSIIKNSGLSMKKYYFARTSMCVLAFIMTIILSGKAEIIICMLPFPILRVIIFTLITTLILSMIYLRNKKITEKIEKKKTV